VFHWCLPIGTKRAAGPFPARHAIDIN